MMPWFLRDSKRLQLERAGIEELSHSADWLVGFEWGLDKGLCLDAVIRAHGHDYEVRVSFPALYPDAPAIVRPRNMQRRLTSHQYGGADGPLCLEWGPDNWHRDVTVAKMLESAHRLFDIENPLGEDRPDIPVSVPSRHRLTVGQELRGRWARWYASNALIDYFNAQPEHSVGSFRFSFREVGENWIGFIHEVMQLGKGTWRDDQIPTTLPGAATKDHEIGIWFKTDLDGQTIDQLRNLEDLKMLLADMDAVRLLAADGTSPVVGFQLSMASILIVDRSGDLHFFILLKGESIIACSTVRAEAVTFQARSLEWKDLNDKFIGIVGLGSVGSKIAMSLARMGVRKFYLIDHDVLLPENLQRHSLDWQGVLQHKVDALKTAIDRVAAGTQIDVCRLHITGQESNASVAGAMSRLASCDMLIDATANQSVFNVLAAIARTAGRPMVWMEVFGGGIGGLVARSRPGTDPTPQDMRCAYLQFCVDNPNPTSTPVSGNYAVENEDGEVLVASDAEVAIIAHHAARFVTDSFIPPERSKFPYSMYLIGFAESWVFEAPFAAIPISTASYPSTSWDNGEKQEFDPESLQFLLDMLKRCDQ